MTLPLLLGPLFGVLGTVRHEKSLKIKDLFDQLEILSTQDQLTELSNRRHFTQVFNEEQARVARQKGSLSLVFFDLDHFKAVNDTFGHHMGDKVLKAIASCLKKTNRPYDTAARWGGEEFVILLPFATEQDAKAYAERLRILIESGLDDTLSFKVTISAGIAQYRPDEALETFVDRADQALYLAKQTGRNKVVAWSSLPSSTA